MWTSGRVRETFMQYFLRHRSLPHVYIPSSSVIPKNDPSLAFVNAGMNQFKDVILGYGRPPHPRVTNSQKCIRISDLQLVGTDTFHHTFFEMLGNWSFSNYFKREACEMAWDLLTNVYKLDSQRLYVTYFSGSEALPIDHETKEIWEDIGVSPSRILPFGKENFWAMGPLGPCGPSTEIHYDHRGSQNDPSEVNQDSGLVVEVWNLVFMQYNRNLKGNLERLPLSHVVDTGAGLERLTAVLNNKISNYDTDLFRPTFEIIHRETGAPPYGGSFKSEVDCGYRVLTDHMRCVTVALADGILPQTNHKIRKLVRRSLSICDLYFMPKSYSEIDLLDFLNVISDSILKSLITFYPEKEKLSDEISDILEYEIERYATIKKSKSSSHHHLLPRLLTFDFPSLAKLKSTDIETVQSKGIVDGVSAHSWYESYGITEEAVEEFCTSFGLKFDKVGLSEQMTKVKRIFRDEVAREMMANDEKLFTNKVGSFLSLYNPHVAGGVYQDLSTVKGQESKNQVTIEWIFDEDGNPADEFTKGETYWVVLSSTIFQSGSSNRASDGGWLELEDGSLVCVINVKHLPSGWILHQIKDIPEIGFIRKGKIKSLRLNEGRRKGIKTSIVALEQMKHWFKNVYDVVRFNNEYVSWDQIQLEFTLLNAEFTSHDIEKVEDFVYESGCELVVIKRNSRENGTFEITCVTGQTAHGARDLGKKVYDLIMGLKELISKPNLDYASTGHLIKVQIRFIEQYLKNIENEPLPLEVWTRGEKIVTEAERLVEKNELQLETTRISEALARVVRNDIPFVLEQFHSDVEYGSLLKMTRVAAEKPTLLVIYSTDGHIQARCCVPKEIANEELSAEKWMQSLVTGLGHGTFSAPRGQDSKLVVNLKRICVPTIEDKLPKGLEMAKEYISNQVLSTVSKTEQRDKSRQFEVDS